MAILSDTELAKIWGHFMSEASSRQELINQGGMDKHALRDAVDAIDQWVSDNKAAFNAAIPQPARDGLSAEHKAEILVYVVKRRWEVNI